MILGVLFGGVSPEHDISIITAMQVLHVLESKKNIVYPIYISKEGELYYFEEITIDDFRTTDYLKKAKSCSWIQHGIQIKKKRITLECMILCNHGVNGEDGMSAALMNHYHIPYVGSSMIASSVTMDKYLTYIVLKEHGIQVLPTSVLYEEDFYYKNFEFTYPKIVKPARLGSSIGISKVANEVELKEALLLGFKYDHKICIQDYLTECEEYNVAVYRHQNEIHASYVEHVDFQHEFLTFDDKYNGRKTNSGHEVNPDMDESLRHKLIQIAEDAYQILECSGVVRIDFLVAHHEVYVNEVNTIPGSLANYLFPFSFYELLLKLIHQAIFEFHNQKNYAFQSSVLQSEIQIKK